MNRQTKELRRVNNQLDKQLTAENNEVMAGIICYLRVANISEYNQEVVRQDLLEMTLSAQERGEDIKTVIGEDYKVFCDNIVASLPQLSKKERIIGFLDILFMVIAEIALINIIISPYTISLIRDIINKQPLSYEISFPIGTVIVCIVIVLFSISIIKIIGKFSIKYEKKAENKVKSKIKSFFKSYLIGLIIMAVLLFFAWIGRDILFSVNIFAACAFVLVMYIIHRAFARYN